MLQRILRTRALLRIATLNGRNTIWRRTLVAPPKAGEVLMERRPDRELPGTYTSLSLHFSSNYLLNCHRNRRRWHALAAYRAHIPCHPCLLHPRHLQLPKVLFVSCFLDPIRPPHVSQSTRGSWRRDLLRALDALDLGGDESVAWTH